MNNIEVKTIYGRIEDFENNYFFSLSISKRKTVGRQTYYVRRYHCRAVHNEKVR